MPSRFRLALPLTFRHRAGVSPYTSPFGFAETCVFAKQLPGPFHCGLLSQAPLLPKLRGQYAEFLNNPSPDGLRILSSSTCVGLRYGRFGYPGSLFSPLGPHASLLLFGPFRPALPITGSCFPHVSGSLNPLAATECLPYVHRLRLPASP